jgi:formyl-CoA transferase/CoA:oxalate CoA-transferase
MAEWVALLADKDICFGPVATVEEMLDDPQARHREMVVQQADRRGEPRRTLGNPLKLSATPPTLRTPPPDFGAHTDEVLAAVGYAPADVAAFRSRGIV